MTKARKKQIEIAQNKVNAYIKKAQKQREYKIHVEKILNSFSYTNYIEYS